MNNQAVLVTGTGGFIGRQVFKTLRTRGARVYGLSRRVSLDDDRELVGEVQSIDAPLLERLSVNTIVHCAGLTPRSNGDADGTIFESDILDTEHLGREALIARVKRFVFISSAKVFGEFTYKGDVFSQHTTPFPSTKYASSKLASERVLERLASRSDMTTVILRPPVVYGVGAKGKLGIIIRLLKLRVPVVLPQSEALFSIISLEKLVSYICICIWHPAVKNRTFLVSDGTDVTLCDLVHILSMSVKRKAKVFTIPPRFLIGVFTCIGQAQLLKRAEVGFQIDASEIDHTLKMDEFSSDSKMGVWFSND